MKSSISLTALAVATLLSGACASATQTSAAFDRTAIPVAGTMPTIESPVISQRTLSNGLGLWVVTSRELPTINASLIVRAGAVGDDTLPGLASITAALLDEGAGDRDALAFTRAVSALGASLGAFAGDERTTISLATLKGTAAPAFQLLGDLVTRPHFADEELARVRKSRLQALRAQVDQPTTIANLVFAAQVYGATHPYGHPSSGTLSSVAAISRDEVLRFYRASFRPENAVMVIVGDVSSDEATALAESALGSWRADTSVMAASSTSPTAPEAQRTAVFLVDKPGAAQSEIRIGHAGVARSSPDYYPLQVMNAVLGGQFSSRINLNLRETRGFTYGARSGFSFDRGPGPFVAQAGVFTAKTDSSLMEFMKELRDIRGARPATEEEITFAKASLALSYPRRIETNASIAGQLAELAFFGLPADELTRYPERINAVTSADVQRVAREYLRPDNSVIVIVGDLATIRTSVESLNLGTVTVLDAEGMPLP